MSNEVIKYENQFNRVALRNFSANELDILMSIANKVREQNQNIVNIDYHTLKELMKLNKNYTLNEFTEEVIKVNRKLLGLNFTFIDTQKVVQFVLFKRFVVDKKTGNLEVSVNEEFSFLLNSLTSNFTRFELSEFVDLRSSYSKECYRRLKQFRTTGIWKIEIEEFRRLLDIPTTYRLCDIDTWVLKPIKKELTPLFKNFKIKKVHLNKRGKPLSHLLFVFDSEMIDESTYIPEEKLNYKYNSKKQEIKMEYKEDDQPFNFDEIKIKKSD